jgi:hypothetical protein
MAAIRRAVEVAGGSFIAVPHHCAVATKPYASSVASSISAAFKSDTAFVV